MQSVPDIPGTTASSAAKIRWLRQPDHGLARVYRALLADGVLKALVSQDAIPDAEPLWHVSVSHVDFAGKPDRAPTWDELKSARYLLLPEVTGPFVLVMPGKDAEWVNLHPTTLHMWESPDKTIDQ